MSGVGAVSGSSSQKRFSPPVTHTIEMTTLLSRYGYPFGLIDVVGGTHVAAPEV